MFNLSGSELVVILLLALVVLGPEKLPEALRRAGRTYAELKKLGAGFQDEVRTAFEEPVKEIRETADLLRKAATFDGDDSASSTAAVITNIDDSDDDDVHDVGTADRRSPASAAADKPTLLLSDADAVAAPITAAPGEPGTTIAAPTVDAVDSAAGEPGTTGAAPTVDAVDSADGEPGPAGPTAALEAHGDELADDATAPLGASGVMDSAPLPDSDVAAGAGEPGTSPHA